MQLDHTGRGFEVIRHETHANEPEMKRIIQQSSAIGDYEDSMSNPGCSFLWVGENHHLNREEVEELMMYMQRWLDSGSFEEPEPSEPSPDPDCTTCEGTGIYGCPQHGHGMKCPCSQS